MSVVAHEPPGISGRERRAASPARSKGVSSLFGGKKDLNLRRVLEKLRREFGDASLRKHGLALSAVQHHPPGASPIPCYATGFLLRRARCSSPLFTKRRASSAWPSAPCSSRYASSEGSSALTVTSRTSPTAW